MSERKLTDDEYEDLFRAVKAWRRDLAMAVLSFTGVFSSPSYDKAWPRLHKNWQRICELDLDLAAKLTHGMNQVAAMMDHTNEPNSPVNHRHGMLREYVGMAEFARDRHPDAPTETVGELIDLAIKTIQKEIDEDLA
jgi:hypothetical protein